MDLASPKSVNCPVCRTPIGRDCFPFGMKGNHRARRIEAERVKHMTELAKRHSEANPPPNRIWP